MTPREQLVEAMARVIDKDKTYKDIDGGLDKLTAHWCNLALAAIEAQGIVLVPRVLTDEMSLELYWHDTIAKSPYAPEYGT